MSKVKKVEAELLPDRQHVKAHKSFEAMLEVFRAELAKLREVDAKLKKSDLAFKWKLGGQIHLLMAKNAYDKHTPEEIGEALGIHEKAVYKCRQFYETYDKEALTRFLDHGVPFRSVEELMRLDADVREDLTQRLIENDWTSDDLREQINLSKRGAPPEGGDTMNDSTPPEGGDSGKTSSPKVGDTEDSQVVRGIKKEAKAFIMVLDKIEERGERVEARLQDFDLIGDESQYAEAEDAVDELRSAIVKAERFLKSHLRELDKKCPVAEEPEGEGGEELDVDPGELDEDIED